MAGTPRLIGVTVLPEYIQSEGVESVLGRLEGAGCNAVTTSPYLMEPADERTGNREPPDDAGAGGVRLLDRPLWGKRELFVRTAPSFTPDKTLYAGLRYQPAEPTDLTRRHPTLIHDFIKAAHGRGIKVYFQVQAAIPPGYRVQFGGPTADDTPRLPDGSIAKRRLAKNGSLASPHILAYQRALITDLVKQYGELDGLRFDWPEYPPYFLDDFFLDFSDHAAAAAKRLGFDFETIRHNAQQRYARLHGGLSDADLDNLPELLWGDAEHVRFKAALSENLLREFRAAMDAAGGAKMQMMPNAFPPPWSIASGLDFRRLAPLAAGFCVKLYTMHWQMMLRFYADAIRAANPQVSDARLCAALAKALEIVHAPPITRCDDLRYPGTDEPHPITSASMVARIQAAQKAAGDTPVYPLAHGYGPVSDFKRRLVAAADIAPHGFWINRYGYLSDEKLAIVGDVARRK